METLDGRSSVDLGGEPASAGRVRGDRLDGAPRPRSTGTPRAAFLAELVAARPSIVVTGAHGKTTTTAMIAFVLRETGNDPAWIVGGVVPQLGGNAGTGAGWLVVEGDESDRSVFALRPRLAVVTNVELDHHATYGSDAELQAAFDAWLATMPDVVRGWELEPVAFAARRPGRAQPPERGGGARGARARRGRPRARRRRRSPGSTGADRRFQLVGERRRGDGDRRLRPQPDRAPRRARDGARANRRAASSRSTSRTSSSGRGTSTASWARRSGSPTSRS